MGLSFREKSLWLMFGSLIVTFAFYFGHVLPGHGLEVRPIQIIIFVVSVVLLTLMQIIGHVLIALWDRRTDADERDRIIALVGTRNGGYVLATGVCFSLFMALVYHGNFVFTHVLLIFWVLAQLVETGTQLYLYRYGVTRHG